jgi:hypothetical protein
MRLALLAAVAALLAASSAPAQARAADTVIGHDMLIDSIWAQGGDLVYFRRGSSRGSVKWFVYDLARNRSRRLSTPATSCPIGWLSVWRHTMAYTTSCKDPSKNGLFLKRGGHTRQFPSDAGPFGLVFGGSAIASLWEDGNDDIGIAQYVAGGKSCIKIVDAAIGDATDSEGWFPADLWATHGYLAWTMGNPRLRSDFAILAAKIPSGCRTPGPIGRFPFKAATARVQALAVDNRHVFYADDKTLHDQTLPAKPSLAPPSNDDFAHARQMSGDAPLSASGDTAHATVESGEPLGRTGHTVWYAYRPKTSGTVYVTVNPGCPNNPPGDACGGSYRSASTPARAPTRSPCSLGQEGPTRRCTPGSTRWPARRTGSRSGRRPTRATSRSRCTWTPIRRAEGTQPRRGYALPVLPA